MKQVIVLVGMVLLGVFIAGYIAGDGDDTVKSSLKNAWTTEITRQNTYP